ncbi:TPA: hypothetical protein JBF73_07805 [Legionella pneumophila]|nr:hypothetical protein [Legionella pneumophila]
MEYALEVTDQEIEQLKSQIEAQKKIQEYEQLKKDLFDISYKANHTLTEFDSGMQQVDTERALKTARSIPSISELVISRIIKMGNVRPIIGNFIALGLSVIGLFVLLNFFNNSDLKSLKVGITYFIELAAAAQILKSASRSIVLPLAATAVGALISNQLSGTHLFLYHSAEFFQAMMIVGLVGIGISVFAID